MLGASLRAAALVVAIAIFGMLSLPAAAAVGPDESAYNATVDKAIAFLRAQQAEDGSWAKDRSLGITGIVVTGLLQAGRVDAKDPTVAKGLKFILSLVNKKEGHLAGDNPKAQLKNYVTSVNVMALSLANTDGRYNQIIAAGVRFLKEFQWDEGDGKTKKDDYYGGAGYDSKSRPDLSNTQYFLEALKAAGVPESDPAYQKALIFISRTQNLKSEFNDQPWAGKINDGGFIYSAANGGESKADDMASYGSMTYAGVKSMIYAGVSRKDIRVASALEWLKKNYAVDRNPGFTKDKDQQALYYYYHTMAKCLAVLGDDYFVDASGTKHDWRKEIAEALAKRQKADGSWINDADRWMEGDPNLVTAYALMTLSHCKPKK
jgi:squalene-hopene/tetraprenyl-beta-curcumene cyclase